MSIPSEEVVDDLLGSGTEEAIYKTSYEEGFAEGVNEGENDGWTAGVKLGADVGFELGRYKGFALAAREKLLKTHEQSCSSSQKVGEEESVLSPSKSSKLCDKIINLVDEFKLENVTSVHEACAQVRTHYNLLKASLGISEEVSGARETISGQKYSF